MIEIPLSRRSISNSIIGSVLSLLALGAHAEEQNSGYVPEGYTLAFSAEFDDPDEVFNRYDNPKFTTGWFRWHGQDDPNVVRRLANNKELQLFVDKDYKYEGQLVGVNPFSVKDGVLTITAEPLSEENLELLKPIAAGKYPAPQYSSGALSTETERRKPGEGYTQLYGYWEMRTKLPKGKGLWPAFWLIAETHDYSDEVDIFEVLGHKPNEVFHSTHFHDGGGTDDLPWEKRISRTVDTSDGFHVYGMQITEDELIYTVDGKETLRVDHTLEVPMYTLINLAVGGEWPGNPNKKTKFPAEMEIDYLRIYKPAE